MGLSSQSCQCSWNLERTKGSSYAAVPKNGTGKKSLLYINTAVNLGFWLVLLRFAKPRVWLVFLTFGK